MTASAPTAIASMGFAPADTSSERTNSTSSTSVSSRFALSWTVSSSNST
ncbi:hypothetical protein [Streptomyces sp. NPDC020917]